MRPMTTWVVTSAVVALLAAFGAVGRTQDTAQEELRKPWVGTWRLMSVDGGPENAANRGAKPTGIIMYDQHGLMTVQIMPDRPRATWTGLPTPEQALDAIRGYTAYWGTYTIDRQTHTVTHHRQGMIDGGMVDYVRQFQFTDGGNRLTLRPISGGTIKANHLTWERVR
jgi:hypothetical protein